MKEQVSTENRKAFFKENILMNLKSIEANKAKTDLFIVFIITLIPLIIYLFFENVWNIQGRDESINFWLRFWIICLLAYGLTGLGFTIVFLFRKEKLSDYGLVKNKLFLSITLSILAFIPHFLFMYFTVSIQTYLPMNGTVLTQSVLSRPFPEKILCMGLIFLIWGFFEGITYVFISQKINCIIQTNNKYLNIGAIICGIVCVLIHGIIGFDVLIIIEAITVFVFIYGIIIIRNFTGNSWGCIFSFLFLWNAFG